MNTISEKTKQAILKDFKKGVDNKTVLAKKYNISPRSVGRILDKLLSEKRGDVSVSDTETEENAIDITDNLEMDTSIEGTITLPCYTTYALGGKASSNHEFPFDEKEANTNGYAIADYAVRFLDDLIKQTDEIKEMCDKLKSIDTPHNLENNRTALVNLIARLKWYELDTASIRLRIHKAEK